MKRLLLLIIILFITTVFFNNSAVSAKETTLKIEEEDNKASASSVVKYDLAYPGILPDNPLYKLKVLRDKISLTIISDPKKKIDFYLLKADKEILASAMLVDKGLIDLAGETALKGEHNYTLLTRELYKLPAMPKEDFYKKLETASQKHQEVLASLVKRVPKDKQKTFLTVIDFSKRNWESVTKYINSEKERDQ